MQLVTQQWTIGMWAMQQFHHKTKKQSFQAMYYPCVAVNMGLVYLLARRNPQAMATLKGLMSKQQQQRNNTFKPQNKL